MPKRLSCLLDSPTPMTPRPSGVRVTIWQSKRSFVKHHFHWLSSWNWESNIVPLANWVHLREIPWTSCFISHWHLWPLSNIPTCCLKGFFLATGILSPSSPFLDPHFFPKSGLKVLSPWRESSPKEPYSTLTWSVFIQSWSLILPSLVVSMRHGFYRFCALTT